jgi:hypothetical protein
MAARFVSSLPMPRSRGWLTVVSVRSALPSFLQVLLDLGFLVEQVEVGAGVVRDDLGPERPGRAELAALADGPAEDEVHLVRAADVQVVADQLLEEDPPAHRPVQGHGGGELDLVDR